MKKYKKYITLKHFGWKVCGTVIINYRGGVKEEVLMDSITLRQENFPTQKQIAKCINAGFRHVGGDADLWVIISADVRLWQVFGNAEEHCIIIDDFQFSSEQIPISVKGE